MTSVDSTPTLRIEEHDDGVIALSGELDMATAPQLRAVLQHHIDHTDAAGDGEVVVDLSGLQFCDSSGIGVLVFALQALPDRFVLRSPAERVLALLRITNLDHEFTIQ